MNKRLLIGFLTCFLLSGFANTARADPCPPPSCPACYTWNGSACVYICGCLPSPIGFSVWPSTNDRYVCIDDTIVFNAQWPLTYDGDGCSLIYIWNFGPGAYDIDLGVDGSYVSCRYGSAGDRTVTLTVTRVTSSDPNSCCSTPRTASFSRTVTVVEVESLQPDPGPDIEEIDDGDGNPNTRSFLVKIADSGVVTVRATPNPVVPEQCLPGYGYTWGWWLEGGTGSSYLTRTVDRTTTGVTTISCVCGSSSKTTKIYVYEAKLKLYAKGGLSYIPLLVTLGDFGHSWWKLEFSHPELLKPITLRLYVGEEIGYWPAEGFPLYNPWAFVPGDVLVYDQGCTEWATGEWRIAWSELRAALYYSMILDNSPGEFSAWYHNCTDEAVTAGEVAGVETIDASIDPTLPLTLFLYLLIH